MASSPFNKESKAPCRKRKSPTSNPFLPHQDSEHVELVEEAAGPASKKMRTSGFTTSKSPCPETHTSCNESGHQHFLSGVIAYILQAGLGKARSEIFQKQMSKFGAEVLTEWNKDKCTHLIVDELMDGKRLMRILKIEKPPLTTEVLKASWLSLSLSESKQVPTDDHKVQFPVVKQEIISKKVYTASTDPTQQQNTDGSDDKYEGFENVSDHALDSSDVPSSSNILPSRGSKWTSPSKAEATDRGYDSDDSNYMPSDDEEYHELSMRVSTASDEASSSSNTSTPATSPQKLPVSWKLTLIFIIFRRLISMTAQKSVLTNNMIQGVTENFFSISHYTVSLGRSLFMLFSQLNRNHWLHSIWKGT